MNATAPAMSHSMVGPRLSAMMFMQFFIWGAWYVSVGNYMAAHGMSNGIFWAYTVGPIAAIVSPLFLGMVADRFFATERVLGVLHLLGGAALLIAPMLTPSDEAITAAAAAAEAEGTEPVLYWPFVAVLLVHMLCYMPTLGLTNTLAFHNMTNQEKQFPLIRVFGTIGWIAANWLVSKLLHADTGAQQFYAAGGASIALGLYSFTLMHTPAPAAGKRASLSDVLGLKAVAMLRQPSFAVFVVSSFLICIPLAAYYAYAPVFASAMGIEDVAFNMSFGQMSEIFFMLVMPLCFASLGVKWMLAVGMLAWVARYGLFAAAANDHVLWMVLAGIMLHGICYDFFFVTGQIYVDKKAVNEIRGQAQGFLVLITQGLGMLLGAQVTGRIVNAYTTESQGMRVGDWQTVWLIACIAAGAVLLIFIAAFREKANSESPEDALANQR